MEAEVMNLKAQAQQYTKAAESESEPQLKVAELQSKMKMKEQELALRQQLSALTNEMRQGQSENPSGSKNCNRSYETIRR